MSHSSPVFVNLPCYHLNTLGVGHLGTAKKSRVRNPTWAGLSQPWHWWDLFLHYEEAASARWRQSELGWWHVLMRGFSNLFFGEDLRGKNQRTLRFLKKTRLGCWFLGGCIFDFFVWGGWISLKHFHPRTRCFFPSCGIVESSDDSSLQRKTGKWCSLQSIPLCCFWSKDYFAPPFLKPQNWWNKQTNKSCWFVGSTGFLEPLDSLRSAHPKNSTKRMSILLKHKVEGSMTPTGGFLKWWYPTTIGFPAKNDHFGVVWGYHHLRKHPTLTMHYSWGTSLKVAILSQRLISLKMGNWMAPGKCTASNRTKKNTITLNRNTHLQQVKYW